jgi:hypothetical protein
VKTVKLTFPPEEWDITKYSPSGKCIWRDYEFILNQEIEEPDYWLVCGNTTHDQEKAIIESENVILDTSESADIVKYPEEFLNQFGYVSSFRNDIKHPNYIKSVPVIPWFIKRNFNELSQLNAIPKTKTISLLASDKKISINHIKRLNFVKRIHEYFGKEIDIYGAGFTNHIYDKIPTLDPYMFTIVLETISVPEYFSEKLGDSYLSLCFPIYFGCNNIETYFDTGSLEMIDINDFDKSVSIIKKILNSDNFYDSRLQQLVEAKNKYLNNYSLFPVMAEILDRVAAKNVNIKSTKKKEITIRKFEQKKDLRYIMKRANTLAYDLVTRIQ